MAQESYKPKFKRKQYIVRPEFQFKYVGIILTLVFLTAALCSYVVYYTAMINMGERLAIIYPQGRLVAIIKLVNLRMLISMILVSPLVAVIGIFLSHRIAGPIYRMEQFLNKMGTGDFTSKLILRQGDELLGIADKINSLSEQLKGSVIAEKNLVGKAIQELAELKKAVASSSQDLTFINDRLKSLDGEMRALEIEFNKYKL